MNADLSQDKQSLDSAEDEILARPEENPRKDFWRRFRRNKAAMVGSLWAIIVAFVAIFANFIQRMSPTVQNLDLVLDSKGNPVFAKDGGLKQGCSFEGPSKAHWLGCDQLGRDMWSRVANGARISMTIALVTIAVSLFLSLLLGALSGYTGGLWDNVIMRTGDMFAAVPYYAVIIAFTSSFGHSIIPLSAAIVVIGWMSGARLFRSSVMQVRNLDYIEASRAAGLSTSQIIRKHVVPNAIQPILATLGLSVGGAILNEAVFAFLGIGLVPPTPSWGVMVGDSRDFAGTVPHLFFVPAGILLITTLAFTFMGDGVRDALDPKLRGVK
jgi:peptide/nickel transport system permease protein